MLLLAALDFGLRRFDLLSALSDDTMPATFFAAVNSQVIDAARTLRSGLSEVERPIVLMGNSQMDFGSRPITRDVLIGHPKEELPRDTILQKAPPQKKTERKF